MDINRAAFLTGSLAVLSAALPLAARSTEPAGVAPDDALARLMAGNKRFMAGDVPALDHPERRRIELEHSQSPFATILSCSDSRVVPEDVFVADLGQLFVVRVAGNYPDDMVIGSIEYAVEHLGTRLVLVLGHENCGAVTAVFEAIRTGKPLLAHLSAIETYMSPGIESVVRAGGSIEEAVKANARAAVKRLKSEPPILSEQTHSGHVRLVGAYYDLGSGEVTLLS
jgi:carbonic anhydrase